MKSKYRTYKIKNGDTLQSVSKMLGINPQEIRAYHNIHCELDDLIEHDFPRKLKILLLSPTLEEKKENFEDTVLQTVKFGADFKLRFKPNHTKTSYGIMYTIETGEDSNTMKYEVSIQLKEQEQKAFHVFEINRISKIYINDEECDSIADELAEKVSSVMYPLQIVVNDEGKWIDVYNFKEIQDRWENKKQEILEEYDGEFVKKYLLLSEESIESRQSLKQALKNDWLLATYFSGIHCKYTPELSFNKNCFFPLLPNTEPLEYNIDQKISKYLDEYNVINIEQEGNLIDQRAKADFENDFDLPYYSLLEENAEKVKGNFRSKYFLNSSHNLIESLFVECSIETDIPKKVQVVVAMIDNVSKKDQNQNTIPETKKESFFSIFKR